MTDARTEEYVIVVDEDSTEPAGYLYSASMFAPIELPEVAQQVRMAAEGLS